MDSVLPVKVQIKAVIIRSDGTQDNLGTISSYNPEQEEKSNNDDF